MFGLQLSAPATSIQTTEGSTIMNSRWRRAICLIATVTCTTIAAAEGSRGNANASQQVRFEEAMRAYETQHFPLAYSMLVGLADEGHAESARIALLMTHYGRQLYGIYFGATVAQRGTWALVASAPI
jgi:hypothetical protein